MDILTKFLIAYSISIYIIIIIILIEIYIWYLVFIGLFKTNTVHIFESYNYSHSNLFEKLKNEKFFVYCHSITNRVEAYLSDKRFILKVANIIRSKEIISFIPISNIYSVSFSKYNPYWLLILAGIRIFSGFIFLIILNNDSISKNYSFNNNNFFENSNNLLIIMTSLILNGFTVFIWYLLKGYNLVVKSGENAVLNLHCRERKNLFLLTQKLSALRLSRENNEIAEFDSNFIIKNKDAEMSTQSLHLDSIDKNQSLEIKCSNCKTILELDENDMKKDEFVCPVCNSINPIIRSNEDKTSRN